MHNLSTLQRNIPHKDDIPLDIADCIANEETQGKIVVVADDVKGYHTQLTNALKVVEVRLKDQRELTDDRVLKRRLSAKVKYISSRTLNSKPVESYLDTDISIATAERLLNFPPTCQTMYLADPVQRETMYMITGWLNKGGRVVEYTYPKS